MKKNFKMKKVVVLLAMTLMTALISGSSYANEDKVFKMSTTTSTQSSGLLDVLLPVFEKDTGIKVKVFAKGTGAAIRDGRDGNVDAIFVHAKSREDQFVSNGYGTKRYAIMHNDFVIIGPAKDPAGIKGMSNAAKALEQIAKAGSMFVSRGDDSGTHTKEQALWAATDLNLKEVKKDLIKKGKQYNISFKAPEGKWYMSIGQGMGKATIFSEEKQAYLLTDRGTFIKYKFGRDQGLDLEVLCEGDNALSNPYGFIPISPKKFPHVKYDLAKTFVQWLISQKGQTTINNYRLLEKQLFYPDAIK